MNPPSPRPTELRTLFQLAGAVVVRLTDHGPEVLLVQRRGVWGLPRAGVRKGESHRAAAESLTTDWLEGDCELVGFLGQVGSAVEEHALTTWYFQFAAPAGARPLEGSARWTSLEEALSTIEDPGELDLLHRLPTSAPPAAPPRRFLAVAGQRPHSWTLALACCGLVLLATEPAHPLASACRGLAAASLAALVGEARWPRRLPASADVNGITGAGTCLLLESLALPPIWATLAAGVVAWGISRERAATQDV